MRRRALVLVGVVVLVSTHTSLSAQVKNLPALPRDTVRARGDTTRRDSTAVDSTKKRELIKWNDPDSVMRVLMARPGYTATRYQGDKAVFNAQTHSLQLNGKKIGRAHV